jgi:signal transduction histidine kinase
MKESKSANLSKIVEMLLQHKADLGNFLSQDPKGKQIFAYLEQLSRDLARERSLTIEELSHLQKNVEHIKEIVMMQQSYAKLSGFVEKVSLPDMFEDALRMNVGALQRHGVQVVRKYDEVKPIDLEKNKILQILVNLIRNAKYACGEIPQNDKMITVKIIREGSLAKMIVQDNGIGIAPENLDRIFNHGFTTRKEGHGFGLHSSALAAKEMGGSLNVFSAGVGTGATFTLTLPYQHS